MTIDECYKILGLSRQASIEEIKTAYRKLIRQWHPDVNKSSEAKEKAKKINEAYQTLSKQPSGPNMIYPEDIFETFFGRRPFGTNPFANFDFDSKITKSSAVLEVDESNSKDLNLIPEILRKAGFIIKSFTITKYH